MFTKQLSRSRRTSRLRLEPLEPRLLLSGGDFLESQALGTVESPDIDEASGMVASRQNTDVIWVHNDSGDSARLFAMNTTGKHFGVYNIDGATNIDWEDIAIGPCLDSNDDCLYIADIGDNAGERGSITVYRVPEPVVDADPISTPVNLTAEVITLQYSGGGRDAESLMIDPLSGDLYIISKRETPSHLYFAEASLLLDGAVVMLQDLGPLESTFASAADISPDGSEMLVRYYNAATDTESVLLYDRPSGMSVSASLFAGGVQVPYELEPNGEAISFNADATGYFTTSEQLHQPINFYERVSEFVSIERSTDVPKTIRSSKTITSTIEVGQSQTIADLEVQIAIDHSRIGDLDIELIGPNGVPSIALARGLGGSNADYPNTIFDDEAARPITTSVAPFVGRYQPEGELSDFQGIADAKGTWTLRISDTRKGVNGRLEFWSLIVTPGDPPPPGEPSLSIDNVSVTEGETATFTVTLNNPPEGETEISYVTSDNTATSGFDYDGVVAPITLVFSAATPTHTIDVSTLNDSDKREGEETFFVVLTGLNSPQGIGTIKDAKGGGGGNGGGGNGGGPKKNAAATTSIDLTDAAFDSFAQQDNAPEATSSPLFDRGGSRRGSEESDDEELAL